uniref:Uncharacterized protein n=1 Tax=Haptolina ericina TaxID=156174 RepID=A0A7S3AJU5_9EUKA
MDVNAILGVIPTVTDGDHVKSQFYFTQYYAGYGFFGTLSTLTTDTMYQVESAMRATFSVVGAPVALPKSILLNGEGWTYLPCPYHTGRGLQVALPTGVSFMDEDQVKSQFVFATFYVGWGWFGTLTDLQPGAGYMLKVHGYGGLATFEI